MAAAEVAFFTERLALKEQELGELKSTFHKYKLKQKVKYDNLKKEVYAYCRSNDIPADDKQNVALLQIKVAEMETELEETKAHSESLHEELNRRQTQINDHMILIRSLESRLKEMSPSKDTTKSDRKNQNIDMERIQQQMLYKDQRIIELNNSILEKERHILDLQEMCREQGEVADVKKRAMKIVQKKFEEMESKHRREVATETDPWIPSRQRDPERTNRVPGASRNLSPGIAVVHRTAGSSPPPLDPQDVDLQGIDEDEMPGTSSGFKGKNLDQEVTLKKKQRKRVTFDLPPSATTSTQNLTENDAVYNQLNETITQLSMENSRLMAELTFKENELHGLQGMLQENQQEIFKLHKDTKNSSLKAKAVAHSRIRELEERLGELNEEHISQTNRLQTEIETLRNTREWEVEQNGILRDQNDKLREKNTKLTAELDSTGVLNRELERKVEETRELLESVSAELDEAEELVVFMEDQKESILDDVEKMKEAIFAQDQFISLLEADIIIYEEHVGLLRESLGASKVDHRSLLRSKAFETKLKALEQEKEQISLKSREEKLKTKALAQKVKVLEEENEKLMERLCEKEMGAADDADMVETCRQLEVRLRESEQNMEIERTRYEIELAAQRVENKQRMTECEELQFRMNVLERRGEEQQQTHVEQDNSLEMEELKVRIKTQEARINELVHNISCLENELDTVRGTNFELQDRLKEVAILEKDYDELIERHRETCIELVNAKDTLEKLQTETTEMAANEKLLERTTKAEEKAELLKKELEHARLTYQETEGVKKELENIKMELERERTLGQEKWQDICRRALEGPSEPGSRKSSMEIQNQQYMIAFEEKIDKLEEDLQNTVAMLAETKIENQELRQQLSKREENKQTASADTLEYDSVIKKNRELEARIEEQTKEEEKLLSKINDLELEASLTGELSVEMGRVIQQFEKQLREQEFEITTAQEKAYSAEMELRLHEMLNEELGTQLDDLREKEKSLEAQLSSQKETQSTLEEMEEKINKIQAELTEKEINLAAQSQHNQLLVQQIQESEKNLTTSFNQTKDAKKQLKLQTEETERAEERLNDVEMHASAEVQRAVNAQEQAYPLQQQPAQWSYAYSPKQSYQQPYAGSSVQQSNYSSHEHSYNYINEGQLMHPQDQGSELCTANSHIPVQIIPSTSNSNQPEGTINVSVEQIQNENEILRQCVTETIQLREDMTQDVEKLLQLKNELEIAVDSLKGEIWTLNGQLKASILDRENLEDRVIELDTSLTEEKKKVAALDVELSEQQELIEKATRQAAESENESNRRLAECLEMESRRVELEQAYSQLTEYYNQLQSAYNMLYAQQHGQQSSAEGQQSLLPSNPALLMTINNILEELSVPVVEEDIRAKLNAIHEKIREKIQEVERLQTAVAEQNRVSRALEDRLSAIEIEKNTTGGEQLEIKNRLEQLQGDLEWKQEEVDSFRRQVDELQHTLNTIIVNDEDDAAKLVTRQADVDSLFRTNAELAHTNVRLQNELDEKEEASEGRDHQIMAERVQELERQLTDWTDSKEEIGRLKEIEKTLNKRILSLEDQLLEKEEQLQEMEEKIFESQSSLNETERLRVLETANIAVVGDLEELRLERDSLRAIIETMEKDQQQRKDEILVIQEKEKMYKEERKQTEEEIKRYQEEIDEMKTDIEKLRTTIAEKEEEIKVEHFHPTRSAWDNWEEEEERENQEESSNRQQELEKERQSLKDALEASQQEREKLKAKNEELEEEIAILENRKEDEKQWDDWEEKETKDDTLEKELKEKEQLLKDSQNQQKMAQYQVDTLKEALEISRQENKELQFNLEELRQKIKRHKEENESEEKAESWSDWGEKEEQSNDFQQLVNETRVKLDTSLLEQEELKLRNIELEEEITALNERFENYLKNEKTKKTAKDLLNEQEDLKQRNAELEEELAAVSILKDSLQEKEKQILELQEQLNSKEGLEDNWGDWESKDNNSSELKEVMQQLEETRNALEINQQEQEELKLKYTEIEEELRDQIQMKTELTNKVRKLEEQMESKEENQEENWGEWGEESRNEEIEQLQEELRTRNNETEELLARISELEKTQEDYNLMVEDAQTMKEKLEEVEKKLVKQINDTTTEKELQEEIEMLRYEVDDLRQKLEDSGKSSRESWNEWGETEEKEANKLKREVEELTKEKTKMDTIITRVEKDNEELLGQLEKAEQTEIQLTRKVEETMNTLQTIQLELQDLREENARLVIASANSVQSENNWGDIWEEKGSSSQAELEEVQRQLSTTTANLQSIENTLLITKEEGQQRQKELEERIFSLQTELSSLKSNSEELKEKEEKLAEIQKKIHELKQQNNLLKDSESRLLDSVDEFGALAEKNQEEVNRLQKVVNDLEVERQKLLNEIQRLKEDISKLQSATPKEDSSIFLKQIDTLKTERDSMKQKLQAIETRMRELEKEKSQVKMAFDQLKAKIVTRRAAAAVGSATPSRAPSRASVASIEEMREEPVELTYQPPVQVDISRTLNPQDITDRLKNFVEEIKAFANRIDSITDLNQESIEEATQILNSLIMGRRKNNLQTKTIVEQQVPTAAQSNVECVAETLNKVIIVEMEKKILELERNIEQFEGELKKESQLRMQMEEQLNDERKKVDELLNLRTDDLSSMEDYKKKIEELEECLLTNSIHHQEEKVSLLEEISTLRQNEDEVQEKLNEMMTALQATRKELESQQKKIEETMEELVEQKRQSKAKDAYIESYTMEMEEIVRARENEVVDLTTMKENLWKKLTMIEIEENESKVARLEALRVSESLAQNLKICEENLKTKQVRIESLELEMEKLITRLVEDAAQNTEIQDGQKTKISELKKTTVCLQETLQTKDDQLVTLNEENATLSRQLLDFKKECDNQKAMDEKMIELEKTTIEYRNEIQRLKDSEMELREEKEKLVGSLAILQREMDDQKMKMEMIEWENTRRVEESIQQSAVGKREDMERWEKNTKEIQEEHQKVVVGLKMTIQRLEQEKGHLIVVVNEKENLSNTLATIQTKFEAQKAKMLHLEDEKNKIVMENLQRTSVLEKEGRQREDLLRQDCQRLQNQLETLRFELARKADEEKEKEATLQQLNRQVSEFESEKEQMKLEMEDKAVVCLQEKEVMSSERDEWRLRFEQAYADLSQFHPALFQAQETISQLIVVNSELKQQLEKEEVVKKENVQSTELTETRIEIEEKKDITEESSSSEADPLLTRLDDVIEHVRNSHLVRAGSPITQPIIRRIRAIWGRRAFRPYFRYCLVLYVGFLHFLLFHCWLF